MQKRTKVILTLLLPIQYIALLILKRFPQFIETYYSQGIYPYIAKISRYVFGWIPFSIGDIIYALLIIFLFRWLFKNIRRIGREPVLFALDITAALSIIYFLFNIMWGTL